MSSRRLGCCGCAWSWDCSRRALSERDHASAELGILPAQRGLLVWLRWYFGQPAERTSRATAAADTGSAFCLTGLSQSGTLLLILDLEGCNIVGFGIRICLDFTQ